MNDGAIRSLEQLVDELMKAQPNQSNVQVFMQQVGLNYSPDPIEQLNSVLNILQERNGRSNVRAKKVSTDEPSL